MPELPEVESVRAQLEPLVAGQRIVEGWGHPSAKFAQAPDAAGPTVTGVARRGKYLLAGLDDGRELVVHLGMTGQLRVRPVATDVAAQPRTPTVRRRAQTGRVQTVTSPGLAVVAPAGGGVALDPYVRAWWRLEGGGVLELRDVRRFGRLAVVPAGEYAGLPTLAAQGPEPWDPALDGDGLWRRLRRSRSRVKTQLLSQRPLAGVGNIYADEGLWRAGVHPGRRTVTRAQAVALLAGLREALEVGLANGGTTLRDYRTPDGQPGRNRAALRCYGRAGRPCDRCGTPLRRVAYDARTTTFCPTCQR